MKKTHSVVAIFISLLWVGCAVAQNTKPRTLPFPEIHLGPNGEGAQGLVWLTWSSEQQLFFTNGFLQGFKGGWKISCAKSSQLTKPNTYTQCVDARFALSEPFTHYRDMATEFYTKYPEDRALPIDRLFEKLVEPEMTARKVHEWLNDLVSSWQRNNSRTNKALHR